MNDRDKIQNYRPVSILNGFSKVYERYLLNSLSNHIEKILSNFIAAYRKTYSSSHVLIRLTENWKKHLDNKKIVGTVLMDPSKAFDCIPNKLLIAELHAYGFNKKALTFLYSYLKRRKQSVKINDMESFFQILLPGIPQGSIFGPIFLNLFINGLFFFIKEAELANFADDDTGKDLTKLLEILRKECETAINWFRTNNMIVNPDNFQSMITSSKKDLSKYVLNINVVELTMESSVKLLGIEIDNKPSFEKHISNICKKASNQLNAICRLQTLMGHKEKEAMINTFMHSNFNYGCLIWHFCFKTSQNKTEKIHERSLKFLSNDYVSSYAELLEKSTSVSMENKRLRRIVYEIFKTPNDLNPVFMKDIFYYSPNLTHKNHNLYIHTQNTTRFENKSLRAFGANIWHTLPEHIKSTTSLLEFIKTWSGPKCKCSVCK